MNNQIQLVTPQLKCRYCSHTTYLKVVAHYDAVSEVKDDYGQVVNLRPLETWQLAECPVCSMVTCLRYETFGLYPPTESNVEVIYPLDEFKIPEGLPSRIKTAYLSALRVKSIDANAYAVMLRRVLEEICIDRGAEGKTLSERLGVLAKRGEIPIRLADMANKLRELGNIGAHADSGELTSAEVPVLDSFLRVILEYIYTAPLLIDAVAKRIDELRQK